MSETTVKVRYVVDDVDAAVAWYAEHLGFSLLSKHPPAFADVTRGPLRLLLSSPPALGRPTGDETGRRSWHCSGSVGGFEIGISLGATKPFA
jgi:catechol 2,3-dioxygenase-like lactoylglutathione lyase family enzyme